MKKVLTLILVFTLLLSMIPLSALAVSAQTSSVDDHLYVTLVEPPEDDPDTVNLYEKLNTYLSGKGYSGGCDPDWFKVLYRHVDSAEETDWVLLSAFVDYPAPWYGMGIIGNRVIVSGTYPFFKFGMALYDAKEDTFYDLYQMTDYSQYNGLAEALDLYGNGKLLGDIDGDDSISVLDVTMLQRCEAKMDEYPESDWINDSDLVDSSFKPIHYYSDFNRDGERSILDVTCMQRYLADMSYPVG